MAGFYQASPSLLACILILAVPVYTSLGLRLYIRITRRAWGPDDWCVAYAAVSISYPFWNERPKYIVPIHGPEYLWDPGRVLWYRTKNSRTQPIRLEKCTAGKFFHVLSINTCD